MQADMSGESQGKRLKGGAGQPLLLVITIVVVVIVIAFALLLMSNTQNKIEFAGGNLIKSAGDSICSFFGPAQGTMCPSN